MKFGFVTCVQFGLSCIEDIYEIGGKLEIVISLTDNKFTKKSGRIYVDEFCKRKNINFLKINSVNDQEVIEAIKKNEIDWLFIIGWGWIAGSSVLDAPKLGCIGWHPSELPLGRGRASIPWAILKELNETAVTLFKLDEGVDTGDIIKQIKVKISPDETATTLSDKIIKINKKLMQETWNDLNNNSIILKHQDNSKATFWPGRTPEDGELLGTMTVIEAERLIRATTKPFPGAYVMLQGYKLIIWKAKQFSDNEYNIGPYIRFSDGFLAAYEYDYVKLKS